MLNIEMMPDIIIKPDGSMINIHPRNGKYYERNELISIIKGNIEILDLSGDKVMVVDEDGKSKKLRFNRLATKMFGSIGPEDAILGNALVTYRSRLWK